MRTSAASKDGVELDMLSWSGRTTLEVLGQAGLGHSFDPLTDDQADDFATAVKEFLWVSSAFGRPSLCLVPRLADAAGTLT